MPNYPQSPPPLHPPGYGPQPSPPPLPPRPPGLLRLLPIVVLVGLLVFVAMRQWNRDPQPNLVPDAQPRPVVARGDLADDERATIEVFQAASPSVLFVTTTAVRRDRFSFNLLEIPRGTGSGFVWDHHGHVVTNFHVIDGADRARITLADQTTWDAVVVGTAENHDLAVLKINAPSAQLHPIPLGTSNDLQVGQKVFAIGNPFGLDQTLTTGVISGLNREIRARTGRPILDMIQTDAAINPGNSGGPLLDSAGRLIGVNTAIYSPSGAYAGIGFAIPVDTVNRVVPQLLRHGRVERPGLGVQIAGDQLMRQMRMRGVLVLRVQPGSAAEQAGIEPTRFDDDGVPVLGDIIIEADGRPVHVADDLFAAIDRRAIGDTIRLKVLRGAKTEDERTVEIEVTLQAVQ